MRDDPLTIDISKDLERIDMGMTHIIMNDDASKAFFEDPNGTLVKVGLHPPTSGEVTNRINKIFYAVITNKELTSLVAQHYANFRPQNIEQYQSVHDEGLRQGIIRNDIEYDLEAADHFLTDAEFMRKAFQLMLTDINDKGLLKNKYAIGDLYSYLDRLVPAILERRAIKDHPVLEEWDRNYGVGGFHFGAEAVEVGPAVTAYTAVEVGLFVTVAGVAARLPAERDFHSAAVNENSGALRLATMSKIIRFGADLNLHAHRFEGR